MLLMDHVDTVSHCVHFLPRYVTAVYGQHNKLLDGQAQRDVQTFLQSDAELTAFAKVQLPCTATRHLSWSPLVSV